MGVEEVEVAATGVGSRSELMEGESLGRGSGGTAVLGVEGIGRLAVGAAAVVVVAGRTHGFGSPRQVDHCLKMRPMC